MRRRGGWGIGKTGCGDIPALGDDAIAEGAAGRGSFRAHAESGPRSIRCAERMVDADALRRSFMLARSTTSFGLVHDFTIMLLTIICLVFIRARIYPRIGV